MYRAVQRCWSWMDAHCRDSDVPLLISSAIGKTGQAVSWLRASLVFSLSCRSMHLHWSGLELPIDPLCLVFVLGHYGDERVTFSRGVRVERRLFNSFQENKAPGHSDTIFHPCLEWLLWAKTDHKHFSAMCYLCWITLREISVKCKIIIVKVVFVVLIKVVVAVLI